ncbi:MAG: phosphoenolpyruvate--protein phosphotransferase [Candidatus Sumerlaeia bacterium]
MTEASPHTAATRYFKGFPASPGIAIGRAFVLENKQLAPTVQSLSEEDIEAEIQRFRHALDEVRTHILHLKQTAGQSFDENVHGRIFDAQLLILDDPQLVDGTIEQIRTQRLNAGTVLFQITQDICKQIRSAEDSYFQERAADVEEIARLLLSVLKEGHTGGLPDFPPDAIVIAHDLGPGQTVGMSHKKVKGFAIDVGGPTSHTAIMAQALKIPAVVATGNLTQFARTGDTIILDGEDGVVILNPKPTRIADYLLKQQYLAEMMAELSALRDLPAVTLDGRSIELSANIELEDEVPDVLSSGADGIGLFRTEFLFVNAEHPPSEEEQFQLYQRVAVKMNPKPVIFRTIDVGGDKFASSMPIEKEINPFLGLRAVRLYRQFPDIFREQLRALLRASVFGKIKIMFPMISMMEEVAFAMETVRQEMAALEFAGIDFDPNIEVGIMIETPAAAMISDLLARKVHFFSIGTNDLIQYTIAVDRNNQSVTDLYEPFHPSVLRLIKKVVDNAHRHKIWVGLCGEMASDPLGAVLLMGLGIDELSMGPINVPFVKKMIRNVNMSDIRDLAVEVLDCSSAFEVKERLTSALHRLYLPECIS